MDSEDEEFSTMFDLGLDLPDDDYFPSSDSEDYDGEDDDTVYYVKGPFSRMWNSYSFSLTNEIKFWLFYFWLCICMLVCDDFFLLRPKKSSMIFEKRAC